MNFKRFHESKNLFDKDNITYYLGYVNNSGEIQAYPQNAIVYIPITYGKTYTIFGMKRYNPELAQRYITTNTIPTSGVTALRSWQISQNEPLTFTAEENEKYFCLMACGDSDYSAYGSVVNAISINCNTVMLNLGSTALPYEPYSSEVWHDIPHYIHNTSTDTLTTLPADIYANDTTATVGLKGNMSQTGTPTPSSPIQPQECGERTGNLFSSEWEQGSINGTTGNNQNSDIIVRTADYIPVAYNVLYSMSRDKSSGYMNLRLYDANKSYLGVGSNEYISVIVGTSATNPMGTGYSFCVFKSISEDVAYIRINDSTNDLSTQYMMVEGEYTEQTMPSYQPYGYKLDIKTGSTTTPVYLGEVESTRRINQLVLTGQETGWQQAEASGGRSRFVINVSDAINADTSNPYSICSHLPLGASGATYSSDNVYTFASGKLYMRLTVDYDTLVAFKAYLAQQYAAGTPVCVWYVLAEPTTGIVNEPIRKIGDYADTVSGITIPTITGKDTFDVQTTLKPSEVSLAYTGWHDAEVKEWDGSEWQDEQPVSLLSASSRPTLTESTPDIVDITEEPEEKE